MERAREANRAPRPVAAAAVAGGGAVFAAAVAAALGLRATTVGLDVGDLVAAVPIVATQAVGLLIAARRPGNRMAWIMCGLGFVLALQALLSALHAVGVESSWLVPVLWIDSKSFLLIWTAVIALLLHFPTGTLPSPRWRPLWFLAVGAVSLGLVLSALKPGRLVEDAPAGVVNPANPTAMPGVYDTVGFLEPVALLLLLAALVGALASLLVRYSASGTTQRLQIRWVVASCAVFVATLLVNVAVRHLSPAWLGVADAVTGLAFTLIPVAVGIAILRRRLYDIDRVINRTVVYTLLSLLLAAAYVVLVGAMRVATGAVTGDSALAVAASTLAVAAMFQPARRRIQDAVDRRFNRARYDAAATLRQFSGRLRDEVDLETLHAELLTVVAATMQPREATLWLRQAGQ